MARNINTWSKDDHNPKRFSEKLHTDIGKKKGGGRKLLYLGTVKVIDRKDSTSLINILQERISLRFPRILVSDQVDTCNFSKLRDHTDDVTLGKVVRKSTDKDVGGIFVLLVPGPSLGVGGRESCFAGV